MAIFQCEIYSEELEKNTSFLIVMPDILKETEIRSERPLYPATCLLHGKGEDHHKWLREAPLESLSNQKQMVFILPYGGNSNFADIPGVGNYEQYIKQELPQIVHRYFGISTEMEVCYGIDSL